LQATGAQQDEEALRKQMDARDIEEAKKNAETSPVRHPLLVPPKTRNDDSTQ